MPRRRERAKGEDELDEAVSPAAAAEAFKIALPSFEGPLDLLLHLIREHRLDVFDIPIALITEKYLEYLSLMEALDLDVAAEFLVMAATLAHIKSRMLLPREESGGQEDPAEEGEDPREALVKRLLEHQKYRAAGEALGQRSLLGRDTFARSAAPELVPAEPGARELAEVPIFDLIAAFAKVLAEAKVEVSHEVTVDRLSIGEAIGRVSERLHAVERLSFRSLFEPEPGRPVERHRLVVTFLAILEMVKLRLLRVSQAQGEDDIFLALREGARVEAGDIGNDDYRG